jgi:general secretion pathway protein B
MSFILDALKKSEAERLRQDTPGFADLPVSAPEQSSFQWIWIVVALVVINLGVLTVILMKPDRVEEPVAATPAAEMTTESPAAAGLSALVDEPGPVRRPAATAVTTPDPITRAVTAGTTQSFDPAPPVARYESPQIAESHATFNDLRAQGVLQLPDMHIDIHVYSSEPEDRFVFVNMSKYKERATLDEGPVVREITPDGVILEHFGTKFLLPRE